MKYLILVFVSYQIFSSNLLAEEFTYKFDFGPAKKIKIELLNSFHVNSVCLENKKECLGLIIIPKGTFSPDIKTNKDGHVLGNPASDYCQSRNGRSEILRDKKNNEYDYCVLKDKYFVDSWDFYSQSKK